MLTVEGKKFDWKNIGLGECLRGNAMDTYFTLKIYNKLGGDIEDIGLVKLYEKLISPLTSIFANMEYEGMLIDPVKLAELKLQIGARLEELGTQINKLPLVPEGINLASNDDLIKLFYSLVKTEAGWDVDESAGFGLYPPYKTSLGQPQTNEETLNELKDMLDKELVKRGLNV